jgi:hypothetical protein
MKHAVNGGSPMNDGYGVGEQSPDPASDRVDDLANELIEASGQYGLRADKLEKAETLLVLSAVRERANRAGLPLPDAALEVVRETVDTWSDDRGRVILRSALGFDHGTVRSRPSRLDLLAAQLETVRTPDRARTSKEKLDGALLDTMFVSRLARDLAAELFADDRRIAEAETPADERRSTKARTPLVLGLSIGVLVVLGVAAFLLLRRDDLMFQPVPSRCSIDVCRDEARAVEAQTRGFTPGGVVEVEIFTPLGENANDLGGVYGYTNELQVDDEGSFTWRYWWDEGMEIGVYRVLITDKTSNESVEAEFEFFEGGDTS